MLDETFQKEWDDLKARGLARSLSPSSQRNIENLSSNDYLGLSKHLDVIAAAKAALEQHGTGGTSSRLLAGTGAVHEELEKNLATFLQKDVALVFSSGYHTNTGLLPALTTTEDFIFFDRLCHASIIDGVRLSKAAFSAFEHNDLADLERKLKKRAGSRRRVWIVTEGFFSMDGDAPPIRDLVSLAKQNRALTYIDEAHSLGLVGPDGRGWAAEQGILADIDVFVGTLSKSLGSQGGFVATSRLIADLLITKSRSFIYTTALAPACAAAANASLALLPAMRARAKKIMNDAHQLRQALRKNNFDCLKSVSPIVPVWTGTLEETRNLSEHLLSRGFFVPSIRPPTIPVGEGRVRLSISYENVKNGTSRIADAFAAYPNRPAVILSVAKNLK